MQIGTKISGAAHLGLIFLVLFGGKFTSEPLPFDVQEVSVITAEQFAALTAPGPVVDVAEAPEVQPAPAPEVVVEPEPVSEPAPVVVPEPVIESTPEPEPPAPAPAIVVAPDPPSTRPQPRPSDRVAPEPVAAPPPDAKPDEETTTEVTPDEGAVTPVEPEEAKAPEEATDRIIPEQEAVAALAPSKSIRPPSSKPSRPAPVVQTQPETETEPDTSIDVSGALAEALASPAPSGPPLSSGEKDAFRVAVQECWNTGSLSSASLATIVVVAVSMTPNGKPVAGTIRMLESSGGTVESANKAFGAAQRAIMRCGVNGFDLPADKYEHWREVEMTFNPERMRIK